MKRNLILILILSLFVCSYAQNKIDSQGRKQGEWKKMEEGHLLYTGQFKDDVPYGVFHYYYPEGGLKSTTEFINGVVKVKTAMYYVGEKKAAEGLFIDQKKDGEWKYWSEEGFLIKIESYKKGVKHGVWKTYMNNTEVLLSEENYQDGVKNGTFTTYYTDGSVNLKQNYINGKLNGTMELYLMGNVLYSKGQYLNDMKTGKWQFYDEQKRLRKEIVYNKSIADTVYLTFYSRGSRVSIAQHKIAYALSKGKKTEIVTMNGKTFYDDSLLDEVKAWTDFFQFCPVTPNLYANINVIKGFEEIDSESIKVRLNPGPTPEVVSEGEEMKMVKSLFNTEIPKEE